MTNQTDKFSFSPAAVRFGVIGAGSWGSALAILLAKNGINTLIWGNEPEILQQIGAEHVNPKYLPDVMLPENLQPAHNFSDLAQCNELLVAVPSKAFPEVMLAIKHQLPGFHRLVYATKGFEHGTTNLLHEVISRTFDNKFEYAVLSGPTFALEVAKGLPTAVTIASSDDAFARFLAQCLHNPRFRAYTSHDVIGVELGGAVKNALAIGAGIADGLGFGANTRAALITRGLAEIMRMGNALGAEHDTLMGLAGMGDLVLTCTDDLSRNRRFGLALAKGHSHQQAKQDIGQVVEGIQTAKAVHELCCARAIYAPIIEQVYEVLFKQLPPEAAVLNLFSRELKAESD